MKFTIKHEIKERIRVHMLQTRKMTYEEADLLQYYLESSTQVTRVKVYECTNDVVIQYKGERKQIFSLLCYFQYDKVQVPEGFSKNSGRAINAMYQEKLLDKVCLRYFSKLIIPNPIRAVMIGLKSIKYITKGVKVLAQGKIEMAVLDAASISAAILTGDMNMAGSVMFLLGIGELLEEWTHKKTVDDLAKAMALNVEKVWKISDNQQRLVDIREIQSGDQVVIHMGNVIPFDGMVKSGEALVNQASLTGESVSVRKSVDGYVYAGTVVEEGEITILVKEVGGNSRYEKIVTMIEESEKLKSSIEGKAAHLADRLVPYTLLGTGLVYLFTRNTAKALSVLMVDFSCGLKLSMPIAVLSAIREASQHHMTVKGGKFLEAIAEADTLVFDKTGTLTKAQPRVAQVISLCEENSDELLRIAACIEEHFPHSMAKAVVEAAKEKKLEHEEMHSKVEYIVAHGITTTIANKRTSIGSYHFIFEDEECRIAEGMEERLKELPTQCSYLYLAIEKQVVAVICIEDPLREEAKTLITDLKKAGFKKIVMMTGDSEKTAKVIAQEAGIDTYFAEVLPEDKAAFVQSEKEMGRKVVMIGDGINDSPALSAADVGIAISEGAELAREIADVTIESEHLSQLVTLKLISNGLLKKIKHNYHFVVGFNTGLLLLGVLGIIQPTTSALLHNTSTLGISLKNMKNIC